MLFVDSDDYYLGNNVLKDLSSIIEKRDVSMIVSKSIRSVAFNSKPDNMTVPINGVVWYYNNEEYLLSEFYCIEVWKGCYNRRLIIDNNLYFRENVAFEDTDWSFMMCLKSTTVALIDFPFYGYRCNPNSTTNALSFTSRQNNVESFVALYDLIKLNEKHISEPLKRKFFQRIGNSVLWCMMKSFRYSLTESLNVVGSIPKRLYNKEIIKELSLLDQFFLFIERNKPIFIIAAIRMLYLIKTTFKSKHSI